MTDEKDKILAICSVLNTVRMIPGWSFSSCFRRVGRGSVGLPLLKFFLVFQESRKTAYFEAGRWRPRCLLAVEGSDCRTGCL